MSRVEELRLQVESLRLEREAEVLQSHLRAADLMRRRVLREGWGDRVDPFEYLHDSAGLSFFGGVSFSDPVPQISRPEDRRNGDNYPFWRSEQEHAGIRGLCRYIATTDEAAIGVLENLTNYVVGWGFGYKATPKDKKNPAAEAVAFVQSVIDALMEANDFEEDLERELFQRSRRDGEFFVGLKHRGGRTVELTAVDPSFVTEPAETRRLKDYLHVGPGLDWKYGVASAANYPSRVAGYFVSWYGSANDWDYFPADAMVHCKLNVDREVKRGLSDFYAVWQNLERAERLLGNTLEGAAVQAAIAYIREHAPGKSITDIQDQIAALADDRITYQTRTGVKQKNIRKIQPGTVADVTEGHKYHAGPLGDTRRGEGYLQVVQGALRKVGIRWTMPEYMISGDASNANFASTLVAESPFTKAGEAKQGVYTRKYREVMWKAVSLVARKMGRDVRLLKRLVEIAVDPPEIAVRNRAEDHTIRKDEHAAGILSLDTWATEAGRDLEDERAKGAKALSLAAVQGDSGARNLGSSPTPSPDVVADTILNDAQIASAVEIVQSVAAGDLPADAALAQLQKFFGMSRDEAAAVIGSAERLAAEAKARKQAAPSLPVLESQAAWQRWAGYP